MNRKPLKKHKVNSLGRASGWAFPGRAWERVESAKPVNAAIHTDFICCTLLQLQSLLFWVLLKGLYTIVQQRALPSFDSSAV